MLIPPRSNREAQREHDLYLDKLRHLVRMLSSNSFQGMVSLLATPSNAPPMLLEKQESGFDRTPIEDAFVSTSI